MERTPSAAEVTQQEEGRDKKHHSQGECHQASQEPPVTGHVLLYLDVQMLERAQDSTEVGQHLLKDAPEAWGRVLALPWLSYGNKMKKVGVGKA